MSSLANRQDFVRADHTRAERLLSFCVYSKLEVETRLRQAPVFALVEAVQPRGAVGDVLLHFVGLDQQIHGEHALAEVALVELALEHELVQVLELREREFLRQQLEADGLIAQLAAQPLERRLQDVRVIEREARHVVHAEPARRRARRSRRGRCGRAN